jgi:hypothetical protein
MTMVSLWTRSKIKIIDFWNIAPCSLVVSMRLWNVSPLQRDYAALYPRLHIRRHENLKSYEIQNISLIVGDNDWFIIKTQNVCVL